MNFYVTSLFALSINLATSIYANELKSYPNATYVEHTANDGDSFRVKIDGENYMLRL